LTANANAQKIIQAWIQLHSLGKGKQWQRKCA